MFKIARKEIVGNEIHLMEIEAPALATQVRPGHHIDVHVNPDGGALTLPIAGYDPDRGTVTVVFKAQDLPSLQLSMLKEGDEVFQVRGPLGGTCSFDDSGKVVVVAEDLGAASLLLRAKEYKKRGAYTIGILGFETKAEIFWEEEFAEVCDELYVCTRDGTYGVRGRITNPLRAVCETHKDLERMIVIGQLPKMKKVAKIAADYDIPTVMSFDAIRQPVGGPSIFEIADSSQGVFDFAKAPEIDANDIDFEKLLARQTALAKETDESASDN
jgi:ferredoxin--NADP+ reductase